MRDGRGRACRHIGSDETGAAHVGVQVERQGESAACERDGNKTDS